MPRPASIAFSLALTVAALALGFPHMRLETPTPVRGPAAAAPAPDAPALFADVSGITETQRANAEALVTDTRRELLRWTSHTVAEAEGFVSSGDAFTGFEHYVHWDWIGDDDWLDAVHPESLVYTPEPDGSKTLVAAMFMIPGGVDPAELDHIGGSLLQWHQHDDLCYSMDTGVPKLAAVVLPDGSCPPGTVYLGPPASMVHVWLGPNECGPFASIEGSAGGQVVGGGERLCDHAHGSA